MDACTDRPFITCHLCSSIDGRISGSFMGSASARQASREYAQIQQAFSADALVYGVNTTKGFIGPKTPDLPGLFEEYSGDFVAESTLDHFYLSLDPYGEIAWESGVFSRNGKEDAQVVVLLCEMVDPAYKAYLRERGVSYVVAGVNGLDLPLAMQKVHQLFGIKHVLVCGGGLTDSGFLSAGLVDELSIVFAPVVSGQVGVATLFDESDFAPAIPCAFTLHEVRQLAGNCLYVVYRA